MHDATEGKDKLGDFIRNAIPVKEKPLPEGVAREEARQQALREHAEQLATWKKYVAKECPPVPKPLVDGSVIKQLRETCALSVGELAEVLAVSPNDVQSFEAGRKTYADANFHRFAAAARDAILENAERQIDER
jgi:DNA-binding transcriptional regulator YiaG